MGWFKSTLLVGGIAGLGLSFWGAEKDAAERRASLAGDQMTETTYQTTPDHMKSTREEAPKMKVRPGNFHALADGPVETGRYANGVSHRVLLNDTMTHQEQPQRAKEFLTQTGDEKVRTGRVIVFEKGGKGAYYVDSLEIQTRYQTKGDHKMESAFTFRSPRLKYLGGHRGSGTAREREAMPSGTFNIVMANPDEQQGVLMTISFKGSSCDVKETAVKTERLIGLAEGETKVIEVSNGSARIIAPNTPLYRDIVKYADDPDMHTYDTARPGEMGPKKAIIVENDTPESRLWRAQQSKGAQASLNQQLKSAQVKMAENQKKIDARKASIERKRQTAGR